MGTVHNHEPAAYACPFCALLAGVSSGVPTSADIVCESDLAVAFVSPRWWPNNPGHVIVIPRLHSENLYDLPRDVGHAVHDLVQEVARAMRAAYNCDGTSTRQHNESAGGQDVWHFHTHVFPRYEGDELYRLRPLAGFVDPVDRARYVKRLRAGFAADGFGP